MMGSDAVFSTILWNKTNNLSDSIFISLEKDHFDSAFSLSELVAKDDMVEMSIEKLSGIHRATAVVSDRKGRNFAVLQCQPNAWWVALAMTNRCFCVSVKIIN